MTPFEAVKAIKAFLGGDYDSPDLESVGPLCDDFEGNIRQIIDLVQSPSEQLASDHLTAAAPELLAILESIIAYDKLDGFVIDDTGSVPVEVKNILDKASRTIKKAYGG